MSTMNNNNRIGVVDDSETVISNGEQRKSLFQYLKTKKVMWIIFIFIVAVLIITIPIVLNKRKTIDSTDIPTTTETMQTTRKESTTTSTSTESSTTTSTSTTSSTTTSSTTTSTSTTSSTTTSILSSNVCVDTTDIIFNNHQFIYSPTSQVYAAGMLNNQFGVYIAHGYGNVTSTGIWLADYKESSPTYLVMQPDRNLVVLKSGTNEVLWASNTDNDGSGKPFCLEMLDSGNLEWIDNTSSIIWETDTVQNV
ncbi:unnamed protein product [Adineta steineri]|uniref:Bulb-type lectin domain-containing protein n=1 Tax=Adineta steineri TaxID=433720 RepID=A0A814D773_9BILA|nr:unnamed protein product [Adineta steineri]